MPPAKDQEMLEYKLDALDKKVDGVAETVKDGFAHIETILVGDGNNPGLLIRTDRLESFANRISRVFWSVLIPVVLAIGAFIWAVATHSISIVTK